MKLNITLAFFLLFFSLRVQAEDASLFTHRKEVQQFVEDMVQKHQLDSNKLNQWLNSAIIQPSILAAIAKPKESLPWHHYQKIFMTPKRINEGVTFWKENEAILQAAEQKYGIPPEIIVAIIGVETFYGKNMGNYRVLDSLVTLAFNYPPRAPFFLSELEQFFMLTQEEGWDPTEIKGSYAGAMGKGQFISSSYRQYAVDFDNNGKRDLRECNPDAIGSVANYFNTHGWQPNSPVILAAHLKGAEPKKMIASKANPKPEYSLTQLAQSKVFPKKSLKAPLETPFALVKLEGDEGAEYWLGAQNFYVITRYNHSDHYAMAVYNLSQEIKTAYQQS